MQAFMDSAAALGITKPDDLQDYISILDGYWLYAQSAEQENSEANCSKEVHRVAHAAQELSKALDALSDKSRARINWAMRRTSVGINDLVDNAKTTALHIGQIDVHGKPVPDWSMAPLHADIGAKLIRLYEKHQDGYELHFGEKLTGQSGFQYGTPGAEWFAFTMKLIFPKILVSQLTSAAEAAREMIGAERGR
jgi:hypothetical protein